MAMPVPSGRPKGFPSLEAPLHILGEGDRARGAGRRDYGSGERTNDGPGDRQRAASDRQPSDSMKV